MKLSREQIRNAARNSGEATRRFHRAPRAVLTEADWDHMIADLKAYLGLEEASP
jgi:hypothetical protein